MLLLGTEWSVTSKEKVEADVKASRRLAIMMVDQHGEDEVFDVYLYQRRTGTWVVANCRRNSSPGGFHRATYAEFALESAARQAIARVVEDQSR